MIARHVLRDRRRHRPRGATAARALARLGLACLGFLPFNFRPGKPAAVFMGDSGSQVLGFTLGALGLATSWKVAETTVATLVLPMLVLGVPILDTALVAIDAARRGPSDPPGRQGPHARTGSSAAGSRSSARCPARRDRRRARRDQPRLQRARRLPDHARRRPDHLRAARPVRRLPRRPRARQATRRSCPAAGCSARSSSTAAGCSRCSSTSC